MLDLIEKSGRYLLILLSKSTVTSIIERLVASATPDIPITLDKRYLDKSGGMTKQGQTLTGVHFIDDTEIVNPTLKLSAFDEDMVNYVYIPSLRRYYYVNGVTYSKGYYYVNLHVDVLMSFKDSIKKQTVVAIKFC